MPITVECPSMLKMGLNNTNYQITFIIYANICDLIICVNTMNYKSWMRLLTGTVPVNNLLLTGTVPVNNSLLTGTL